MKKLIAIAFFAVTLTASAQISSVDSIFSKDQTTSFLTAYNFNNSRTANFEFENPRFEKIYISPIEHWEKYIKGTYNGVDSITYRNRESLEPITEVPMQVRMVFLWKNGEQVRSLAYGFIGQQLRFIFDSDLIEYYSTDKQ